MTQNEHVYAFCCRLEGAGDIISSTNVRTNEGYIVLNFEVAGFSSFRDIEQEKPTNCGTRAAGVLANILAGQL